MSDINSIHPDIWTDELRSMRDDDYRSFQSKLIPNIGSEAIIGVRTPALRSLAKHIVKSARSDEHIRIRLETFLNALPHRYFDEDQLHAFIISECRDPDMCLAQTEQFLPFVDNWATCDQMSPRIFRKCCDKLMPHIKRWLASDHTYTVRFAVGMLMTHFLDEDFSAEYMELAAGIRSEEYYIRMMIAWYFATALAKHYEAALDFIENRKLDSWTHNKTIQKAIESYRILPEHKEYLKTLRV